MTEKMVLIEWLDSNIMHGWRTEEEVKEDILAHCKTIGFLIAQNDKCITLTMGISDFGSVLESITIPKGCIKSMRELRLK